MTKVGAAAAALQAQLGEVVREEIGAIAPIWARRFALACGETDAVYFDDAAAAAAGWHGVPVPPLLLSSTRSWRPGPARAELQDDGMPLSDVGVPGGYGLRTLGGGQSLRVLSDVVAGVELVSETELQSAVVKEGSSGELLVVGLERRFFTDDGALLLVCDEKRILR